MIESDKTESVWFDENGVPLALRTEHKGTPIDLGLVRRGKADTQTAAIPR